MLMIKQINKIGKSKNQGGKGDGKGKKLKKE